MRASQINKGHMNGPAVGIILKECVRRAMRIIQSRQVTFDVSTKDGYDGGKMNDVFTDADTAAQESYLRTLRECFPHCGILAEEKSLSIRGDADCNAYFTVDPLDGTKAFIRRQTHGVGTMIALVERGVVTSAFIGDINADVVYGFRPESKKVHRINRLDTAEELTYHNPLVAGKGFALLRDPLNCYSREVKRLMSGYFNGHNVDGGSIGTWAARLWRREVQALVMGPGFETPWDASPVVGISLKLGYVFLRPAPTRRGWERYKPRMKSEAYLRQHDTMIVHKNDLAALDLLS